MKGCNLNRRWEKSSQKSEDLSLGGSFEIVGQKCRPSGPFSLYGCQPKNRNGPPKWMVYFMENLIKMDDLGVPLFLETPILKKTRLFCSIVSDFGLNQVDDFGLCFFF